MTNEKILTTLSERKTHAIVRTLLLLMPIIGMAVDLVAPSLPAIATDLHVLPSVAKGVIAIYLLGYALGNFISGFLTDAWGRRQLLRLALFGFALSSLAAVIFPTIHVLLLVRFLQGFTIGGVAVIARAIYADILPAEKLIRMGPLISTMWAIGPVIGPVLGGYLQFYFGWQAGFYFFAFISFTMLVAVIVVVPETQMHRHGLDIKTMRKNLTEVVRNRLFMALAIIMGLTYSLIVVFNTTGPFLIQTEFHNTPVFFGHLALCLGLVFLLATIICRSLLKHFETEYLFLILIHVFLGLTFLFVIASYFFSQSMVLVTAGSMLMFFASGFIFPASMGKGMSLFSHIAGTASALMYLVNILLTSLCSFLMSFVNMSNAIPLMWIYFLLMGFCTIIYWWLIHRSPPPLR